MTVKSKYASCSSFTSPTYRPMYKPRTHQRMHSGEFSISVISVVNPFNLIVESRTVFGPKRNVGEKNKTPLEAVGSWHLCSKSQHSYYGHHVACKVLCMCFDQSLFGVPSRIKMFGI